jgi:RNA polymerase sigma factor (sigma-70 family)
MVSENELVRSVHAYWSGGELGPFMERAWPFLGGYVERRLHRDPDVVGEFLVHVYERMPAILDRFKERQDRPVRAYLAVTLRYEFYNFIKRKRNSAVPVCFAPDFDGEWGRSEDDPDSDREQTRRAALAGALGNLDLELRTPIKLYHGLELDVADLRLIAERTGDAVAAARFTAEFRRRRAAQLERAGRWRDRARHLERLLHARPAAEERRSLWRRHKRRLESLLIQERGVFSLQEISVLFGVSKSTVKRRLERAAQTIREELTCKAR